MQTQAHDEAEILRLDCEWNEAYRRHDRSPLAHILADDFTGLTASGDPIIKAALIANPPGSARSVTFSEQFIRAFGDTGISRGRLQLEFEDRSVDQSIPARLRQARRNLAGGLGRCYASNRLVEGLVL